MLGLSTLDSNLHPHIKWQSLHYQPHHTRLPPARQFADSVPPPPLQCFGIILVDSGERRGLVIQARSENNAGCDPCDFSEDPPCCLGTYFKPFSRGQCARFCVLGMCSLPHVLDRGRFGYCLVHTWEIWEVQLTMNEASINRFSAGPLPG